MPSGAVQEFAEGFGKRLLSDFETVLENTAREYAKNPDKLFQRELEHEVSQAFERGRLAGYEEGFNDGMAAFTWFLAALVFLSAVGFPMCFLRLREIFRPWLLAKITREQRLILYIQSFSHPVFDRWHTALSMLCGVEFYILVLPFLFWIGEQSFARSVCCLMALCVYVGNAAKDIACSPRPASPPIYRHGGREMDEHAMEYGFPSTHAINTIAMFGLALYHSNGRLSEDAYFYAVIAFVFLVVNVCLGRLYLGMHSPIDVLVGVLIGFAMLAIHIATEDHLHAWITNQTKAEIFGTTFHTVAVYQVVLSAVLCLCYPVPLQRNPSYKYVVAFVGVNLGMVWGVSRTFDQFHMEPMMDEVLFRRDLFSISTWTWLGQRLAVGFFCVAVSYFTFKGLARFIVPRLCSFLGLPVSDHKKNPPPPNKQITTYDSSVMVSFVGYSAIAWGVVEPSFYAFRALGL